MDQCFNHYQQYSPNNRTMNSFTNFTSKRYSPYKADNVTKSSYTDYPDADFQNPVLKIYTQKIAFLENANSNLQKMNEKIISSALQNQQKINFMINKINQQNRTKDNKIYYLQETLKKMNKKMRENHELNTTQNISNSLQKNKYIFNETLQTNKVLKKNLSFSKNIRVKTEESKQNSSLPPKKEGKIENGLKQITLKQQKIKMLEEEYKLQEHKIEIERQKYKSIIREKQDTILKLSQALAKRQTNQAVSLREKKKLQLTLHDNKKLKEKVEELENQNKELIAKITQLLNYKKDQYQAISSIYQSICKQRLKKESNHPISSILHKYKSRQFDEQAHHQKNTQFIKNANEKLQLSKAKNKQFRHLNFKKNEIDSPTNIFTTTFEQDQQFQDENEKIIEYYNNKIRSISMPSYENIESQTIKPTSQSERQQQRIIQQIKQKYFLKQQKQSTAPSIYEQSSQKTIAKRQNASPMRLKNQSVLSRHKKKYN